MPLCGAPVVRPGRRRGPLRCREATRTEAGPGPVRGRGRPAATPAPARCGVLVAALALRFGMHGDRVVRVVLCIAPERDVLGMLVRGHLPQGEEIERGAEARVRQRAHHPLARARPGLRSEEHTSELQSLMRTSYAVFCLQK